MNRITEILGCRLVNADMAETKELLKLFETLVKCGELPLKILNLIGSKLQQLLEETCSQNETTEEDAIEKLLCRIASCKLAAAFYHEKIRFSWVVAWKNVSKSEDEFAEIRKIEFR